MTAAATVLEKRRALVDALYAMHTTDGRIRIDEALAQALDRAWEEYDEALNGELRAEVERWRGWARTLTPERCVDLRTHGISAGDRFASEARRLLPGMGR